MRSIILFALTVAGVPFPLHAQEILKHPPPFGTMRPGTVVYVDNGRCPAEQIWN